MATNSRLKGSKDAIDAAKSTRAPIELIVANGADSADVLIDYHGGLRYPHLERNNGAAGFSERNLSAAGAVNDNREK